MINQAPTNKRPEPKGLTMDNASPLLQVINTYIMWLIALVVVVVLAAGYQLFVGPKIQVIIDKNQTYLPLKESTLKDLQAVEQKLIRLRQEYASIQTNRSAELDKLFNIIPSKPDFPSLFVQAEYLANKRELSLESIDISRPADPALSERQAPSAAKAGSTAEQQLEILPRNVASLTIGMKIGPGTYEGLQLYLDDLERNLRLFDIQSLSFGAIDKETKKISGFDLTIKTYYRTGLDKPKTVTTNQSATTTLQ